MKINADRRLFWFLKEGVSLDLSDPATLDMVIQQVMSRGGAGDVRALLKRIPPGQIRQPFERLKRFLPVEVGMFWEDFLAGHQ